MGDFCLGWYFQIIFQPAEASDQRPCLGVVGIQGVLFRGCFHPTTPSTFMVYSVLLRRDMKLANGTTCVNVGLHTAVLTCELLSNVYLIIKIIVCFLLHVRSLRPLFVPAVHCSQMRRMGGGGKGRAL